MSDETASLYLPPPIPWSEAVTQAVTHPSVRSYERLARDTGVTAWRAYGWVFWSAFTGAVISIVVELLASEGTAGFRSLRSGTLIAALVDVLLFIVATGAIHLVARPLGGTGTHGQLAFTIAAFYSPYNLLLPLLDIGYLIVPPVGAVVSDAIGVALWACLFLLTLIAIKAVHGFGWARAVAASSPLLLVYGGFVTLIAISMLPGG
jgi:hypothetical protein